MPQLEARRVSAILSLCETLKRVLMSHQDVVYGRRNGGGPSVGLGFDGGVFRPSAVFKSVPHAFLRSTSMFES